MNPAVSGENFYTADYFSREKTSSTTYLQRFS